MEIGGGSRTLAGDDDPRDDDPGEHRAGDGHRTRQPREAQGAAAHRDNPAWGALVVATVAVLFAGVVGALGAVGLAIPALVAGASFGAIELRRTGVPGRAAVVGALALVATAVLVAGVQPDSLSPLRDRIDDTGGSAEELPGGVPTAGG